MPCRSVDGALGQRAQGVARDAERRRLLLHRAGVGDDRARPELEREELDVAERRGAAHARRPELVEPAGAGQEVPRARVQGEDHRVARLQARERRGGGRQAARVADGRRAVQRHQDVAARRQPVGRPRGARPGAGVGGAQGVDGGRADRVHAALGHALGQEVAGGVAAGGQQRVGEAVDDDAVDLLRRRPVQRAQARLEVGDGDAALRARQRAGQRRVRVAGEHDEVGPHAAQDVVEAGQRRRGELGGRRGGRADDVGGGGQPEVVLDARDEREVLGCADVHDDLAEGPVGRPARRRPAPGAPRRRAR